jgi:hypothetical protein
MMAFLSTFGLIFKNYDAFWTDTDRGSSRSDQVEYGKINIRLDSAIGKPCQARWRRKI